MTSPDTEPQKQLARAQLMRGPFALLFNGLCAKASPDIYNLPDSPALGCPPKNDYIPAESPYHKGPIRIADTLATNYLQQICLDGALSDVVEDLECSSEHSRHGSTETITTYLRTYTFHKHIFDVMAEALSTQMHFPINLLYAANRHAPEHKPVYRTFNDLTTALTKPWFSKVVHQAAALPNGVWGRFSTTSLQSIVAERHDAYILDNLPEISFVFSPLQTDLSSFDFSQKTYKYFAETRKRNNSKAATDSTPSCLSTSGCPVRHKPTLPTERKLQGEGEETKLYQEVIDFLDVGSVNRLVEQGKTGIQIGLEGLASMLNRVQPAHARVFEK